MAKKNCFLIVLVVFLGSFLVFAESISFFAIKYLNFGIRLSILLPFILVVISNILIVLHVVRKYKTSKLYKLIFGIATPVFSIAAYALLTPIYPEDFESRPNLLTAEQYPVSELQVHSSNSTTCFFLISCPFCENAVKYLDAMHKNGQLKDLHIIYYSHQKTADSLVKTNNISIPYSVISDKSFFKLGGKSFPSIVTVSNNQVKFWSGNDVNFACMDYLRSVE